MDFYFYQHPLAILVIAIAILFVLILRLKVNAFLALIAAAVVVGMLSPNIGWGEVMAEVTESLGRVCGSKSVGAKGTSSGGIAIVIALAAIIGQCLMESGAADKIVRVFVRALGEKRAPWALLLSGYVLAVPVFFDTVFYLLIPLARATRVRTGKDYLLFIMVIGAGGAVTHTMVPPTPGPLAMADSLQVDLGMMILAGLAVGACMALAGLAFSMWLNSRMEIPMRETAGLSLDELETLARQDESKLPSFGLSMLPIVLPVLLITTNTLAGALDLDPSIRQVTGFLGDPNFALMTAAAISMFILARQKGVGIRALAGPVETSLASAGLIILITAAGGAFGGLLAKAQVGNALTELAARYGLGDLMLGFLLAALFKIAQGSSTVAMITVASIMADNWLGISSIVGELSGGGLGTNGEEIMIFLPPSLGFHPVYLACAIGCGSLVGSWMNDSGFWVYKQMSGLTELEALKSWTPLLVVLAVAGYLTTEILSRILPLL